MGSPRSGWSQAWSILPCLQEETGQEVLQAGSPGWWLKALRADAVSAPRPVQGHHHRAGASLAAPSLSVTAICCIYGPPPLSPITSLGLELPTQLQDEAGSQDPRSLSSVSLPSAPIWLVLVFAPCSRLHPLHRPPAHGPAALSMWPRYSALSFRSQLLLPILKAAAPQIFAGAPMRTPLLSTSRRIFHNRM